MLHAYIERFDVISKRENILSWDEKVNKAIVNQKPEPEVFFLSISSCN
jgi:hypothetical protein